MTGRLLWLCVLLAAGTSAGDANLGDPTPEQQLCDKMVRKFNTFVDMVPLIMSITFPSNNDYFIGSSEVILYTAEDSNYSPKCTVMKNNDLTLLRVDVYMRIDILNNENRMEISQCKLEIHLRLQKDDEHLFLDPQLVDVQIPGKVYKDGVLLGQEEADEILRPTLIKGFTNLASKHLSYSGYRSKAVYVDPDAAAYLFKQLVTSYVSQIVQ